MVMQKHDQEIKALKEQSGRTTEETAKMSGRLEMVLKSIHAQPPPVAAEPAPVAAPPMAADPAAAQMAPAPVPPSMPPPGVVQ